MKTLHVTVPTGLMFSSDQVIELIQRVGAEFAAGVQRIEVSTPHRDQFLTVKQTRKLVTEVKE